MPDKNLSSIPKYNECKSIWQKHVRRIKSDEYSYPFGYTELNNTRLWKHYDICSNKTHCEDKCNLDIDCDAFLIRTKGQEQSEYYLFNRVCEQRENISQSFGWITFVKNKTVVLPNDSSAHNWMDGWTENDVFVFKGYFYEYCYELEI